MSLLGGEPGVGKSTLALQLCSALSKSSPDEDFWYVSGEETNEQVQLRAKRLGMTNADNVTILAESNVEVIMGYLERERPKAVVIDSIQTMWSGHVPNSVPGSVLQVKESATRILRFAKQTGTAVIITGHVTKTGDLAGPRVLEHLVDTVLSLEGEKGSPVRLLRCFKNRFGATTDVAVLELGDQGMSEVVNPAALLLSSSLATGPGSCIGSFMEGSRPLLVEVQALVSRSFVPRHRAIGFESDRLHMLLAVLEKMDLIKHWQYDVYVNLVGGIRVRDPSCDLAVIATILSSFSGVPIPKGTTLIGEIGLTSEIRNVSHAARIVNEAVRLGFTKCIVPYQSASSLDSLLSSKAEIIPIRNVSELVETLGLEATASKPQKKTKKGNESTSTSDSLTEEEYASYRNLYLRTNPNSL
jgi:DNA repair protein RadA/Sms